MIYKSILKPILFRKDAESAHELAVHFASKTSSSTTLKHLANQLYGFDSNDLSRNYFGLHFPNPVGLAAGFDKNGVTPKAMQALGFGFVEVGSITAKPSKGNPKPRAFRLPKDESLINRMGLNNEGAESVVNRLSKIDLKIPLGINIAKTNDASVHGDAALEDYLFSYELANTVADYITVNISCPNTGEGKTFEDPDALEALLKELNPAKSTRKPTLVKLSVDTNPDTLDKLVEICESNGIAGYVATNTSSTRDGIVHTSQSTLNNIGNGGLSGKAIAKKSTNIIKVLHGILNGSKPIIGVGGISDAESAVEKINAGASLLQVYTGLIYEGPALVKKIKKSLID